ncbi:MAG: mechanosensitive ion channel domain-containing protein [Sphingomonadaceae bacterium]
MDPLAFLDFELFQLRGTAVTVFGVLTPILILLGLWFALKLLNRGSQRLRARADPSRAFGIYALSQVLRYVLIFAGVLAVARSIGFDLTSVSIFAGALGVGVGLGLQDIVKNFVNGLILLFDKSIEVGDFIELEDGTRGQVIAIGPRATTIQTNDKVDILLPNSLMLDGKLTNWTRNQATRRVRIPFGVAYGSDKEKVREAALEAARAVPFTMPETPTERTQVWLTRFGDSSLDFELVVWPTLEAVKRPGAMFAAYNWALEDALRKHGIEIPFPQRDLHIRSLFGAEGEAARAALNGGRNDAADDIAKERQPPEAGT